LAVRLLGGLSRQVGRVVADPDIDTPPYDVGIGHFWALG
jgi:hypothetical protein